MVGITIDDMLGKYIFIWYVLKFDRQNLKLFLKLLHFIMIFQIRGVFSLFWSPYVMKYLLQKADPKILKSNPSCCSGV